MLCSLMSAWTHTHSHTHIYSIYTEFVVLVMLRLKEFRSKVKIIILNMKQNASITPPVRVGGHSHVTSGKDSDFYRTKHTGLNENMSELYKHITVQNIWKVKAVGAACVSVLHVWPVQQRVSQWFPWQRSFAAKARQHHSFLHQTLGEKSHDAFWNTGLQMPPKRRTKGMNEGQEGGWCVRSVCGHRRWKKQQQRSGTAESFCCSNGSCFAGGLRAAWWCYWLSDPAFYTKHPTTTSVYVCPAADQSVK